jgi:signal transduction histidine kinase
MFNFLFNSFKGGISKVKNNPQLFYSIFVAVVIISAFAFMAERFVSIASDAQERLINIRVGSIQDSFASFAADRLGETDYLNDKIAEIIAVNETISDFNVVSKTNGDFIIIASNDINRIGESDPSVNFLYSLATSDPSHSITIQLENINGRLFQTARAIKDEVGNVLGVVMTTQTLSQADKLVNDNIRNSLILLIVIVLLITLLFLRHSKIVDYMNLYKKLKEVDQLKDDFISMASHELRSPLTTIRGYAEFISEAKELLPETKDFANKIDISAKDLDALVSDILDVSRIQQGQMSFKLEKVNPVEMLEEIVQSYIIPAKDKGLKMVFDKTAVSPDQMIMADKSRLRQVFVNFIGNAVKYTPNGEVVVRQYAEDGRLFIRVIDTGIGMSAEEKERLFEKFYRIKTKETEDIRGTGLGLWITAQIVSELKGKISVESIKGVGSHFIVSFPIIK